MHTAIHVPIRLDSSDNNQFSLSAGGILLRKFANTIVRQKIKVYSTSTYLYEFQ